MGQWKNLSEAWDLGHKLCRELVVAGSLRAQEKLDRAEVRLAQGKEGCCTSTNLTVIMKASSGSGQLSCWAVWLIWAKQVDRSTAEVLCFVSSPRGTSWGKGRA